MRFLQRRVVARAALAVLVGVLVVAAAWRAGVAVLAVVAAMAVAAVVFALLTIAPDAIAWRRGHHWRWWWRGPDDDGPVWPGTRIPRHPRRPR